MTISRANSTLGKVRPSLRYRKPLNFFHLPKYNLSRAITDVVISTGILKSLTDKAGLKIPPLLNHGEQNTQYNHYFQVRGHGYYHLDTSHQIVVLGCHIAESNCCQ